MVVQGRYIQLLIWSTLQMRDWFRFNYVQLASKLFARATGSRETRFGVKVLEPSGHDDVELVGTN